MEYGFSKKDYSTNSNEYVILKNESASSGDLEIAIENLSRGQRTRKREAKRLISFIENCERLKVSQKIELERKIVDGFNSYWGFYTTLRQSLYNLIMLKQKEKDGFFREEELASSKTMMEYGILYRSYEEELLETRYGTRKYEFMVYKLTEYGKSIFDKLVEHGIELAEREKSRLEKIGF